MTDAQLTRQAGQPLTAGGKPEVLYVSTQYCPYCAAENWALLVALGRFGVFSDVSEIRSASGRAVMIGSPVSASWLEHLTWSKLISALRARRGMAAQAVIGAADYTTAELCTLTGNRPTTACPASIKGFLDLEGQRPAMGRRDHRPQRRRSALFRRRTAHSPTVSQLRRRHTRRHPRCHHRL